MSIIYREDNNNCRRRGHEFETAYCGGQWEELEGRGKDGSVINKIYLHILKQ